MSFVAPTPLQWREHAEKALKGRAIESLLHVDPDGLIIRPLYAAASGVQTVFAPRTTDAEGRAWDLRTLVEGDDAAAINQVVLTDLENGAASVLLKGGFTTLEERLTTALDGVALEMASVALDAGFEGVKAAEALASVAKGSPRAQLHFHLDPISAFAEAGSDSGNGDLNAAVTEGAQAAARLASTYPEAKFFLASGRVVHEAGGSAGQELAFAAASSIAYVKAAVRAGMTTHQALKGVVLGVSLDVEYFDAVAKVRALRLIWANLSKAFGHQTPAVIEGRSSRRMLSARDPWPNLLRLTAAGFAGAVGGADVVVLDAFTRAKGRPDAFARRQARNTQLVLMEEANLGRVDDPAAGSWFLDSRTREMAEAGWRELQFIEGEGGVAEALNHRLIQPRIERTRNQLEAALRDGVRQMIGVTKYVDPDPRHALVEQADAAAGPVGGDALTPVRFAAPFERASGEESQ